MAELIYHPEAKAEMKEAAKYYEERRGGLGKSFLHEVETVIEKMRSNPLRCGKISGRFRCCMTKRFPYGIIYAEDGDAIFVAAVMHMKRKPGYWKTRVDRPPRKG